MILTSIAGCTVFFWLQLVLTIKAVIG